MCGLAESIESINWHDVSAKIHEKGFAVVPGLLSPNLCHDLTGQYDITEVYRKTVNMERYRFGRGEYKYWGYPLPDTVQTLRESLYPELAPIANQWMQAWISSNR